MEDNRSQSEFNMAVSYLNRLNILFYNADEAAMSLDVYTWFHTLMALYRELSTEMKPEEKTAFENRIQRISPRVNITLNEQIMGHGEVPPELYNALHEFEIELRRILKASGLQMKVQEDALRAFK